MRASLVWGGRRDGVDKTPYVIQRPARGGKYVENPVAEPATRLTLEKILAAEEEHAVDHDRIPERVVHTRGPPPTATPWSSLSRYTKAPHSYVGYTTDFSLPPV